ncbi:MAG: hypothetical protein IPK60_21070 [Sandaracinaceae bacterium]|nr:hypothetical protein [Sandaracinaceae bacterium]
MGFIWWADSAGCSSTKEAELPSGRELARQETNQAQADLHSAQTGIGAARASLQRLAAEEERARALLATAEREAARSHALFDAGALSGQQRDETSDDRLRVARAELDRVLAQRSEATRGIDVAAGGAEQRRVAMVRATLLAPFDGLVIRRLRAWRHGNRWLNRAANRRYGPRLRKRRSRRDDAAPARRGSERSSEQAHRTSELKLTGRHHVEIRFA